MLLHLHDKALIRVTVVEEIQVLGQVVSQLKEVDHLDQEGHCICQVGIANIIWIMVNIDSRFMIAIIDLFFKFKVPT